MGTAAKVLAAPFRDAAVELDFDRMDDGGMYAWAAILTVVALAASYGIAVWWQRRRDKEKARD